MYLRFFFILFCLSITSLANSQTSMPVKWKQFALQSNEKTQKPDNQNNYYLAKISNLKTSYKQKQVENRFQRILDKDYAIISLSIKDYEQLKKSNKAIWEVNNLWKYSENLLHKNIDDNNSFMVKTKSPGQLKTLVKEKTSLKIVKSSGALFILYGYFDEIKSFISTSDHVYYVGLESLLPKKESKIAELDLSVNTINKIYNENSYLNGLGQTISIKDNLFDENDLDLAGKYVPSSTASSTIDAHATVMATIAAGSGNTSIKGKGVAFKSKITSSDFESLLPDQFAQLSMLGVNIQNHSYGTEIENFYGSLAEAYDEFCYANPEFLHIFSSGNSGENTSQSGNYQGIPGFANQSGNFKMAKNTLCIGAMDFNDKTAIFSSRGPAHDGRIKPELVAYSFVGTSNSTALTSGLCLLLQQQYINNHGDNPLSALIKACLINSASDIGNKGPDFKSGYGNINGYDALKTINNNHYVIDEVVDNESKSYNLSIPANACNLKLTLVWTDPAAQVNSNIALVNDLDFKLIAPDASEWLPWVLDASPDLDKLNESATRKADHLNNIEQITLENLQEGTYTIEINGFDISSASQKFALAYQWCKKDTFEWNFPTKNDAVALGENPLVKIKWLSTYSNQNGELSVSYDDGSSWQIIDYQTVLNNKNFLWSPESGTNSVTILKMKIDGTEYLSDTFVVSDETNTKVTLDCDESVELNWNESPNASSYNIFNYQNQQMVKIATKADTSFTFEKLDYPSSYFAVEPIFVNDFVGQRSETIDYSSYGAGCYFDSFYAFAKNENNEQGIEVFMEFGSNYLVEKIELNRILINDTELLKKYDSLTELILSYYDAEPLQGLNQYQLRITLADGKQYLSEIINAYFLSDRPFLIFPNPANKDGVNIYSKNFGDTKVLFTLFNTSGQKIFDYQLQSERDFIELDKLKAGTYIYKLESSNGIIESSVLIVH